MNKLIKELSFEAGFYINPDFDHPLKKFAELIVKECIDKAERYGLGSDAVEQLKEDLELKNDQQSYN